MTPRRVGRGNASSSERKKREGTYWNFPSEIASRILELVYGDCLDFSNCTTIPSVAAAFPMFAYSLR